MANLYLLPSLLSPEGKDHISPIVIRIIGETRIFIVERTRTARRFIKLIIKDFPIDEARFYELDKHDLQGSLARIREVLNEKRSIGLLSEAGTPCIADPGAEVVNIARRSGYKICPLTGPSSIMLSVMSSGMNGQHFTFHGYLPIKNAPLIEKLKEISSLSKKERSAHIFIETPYRNAKLKEQIVRTVDPSLYLSVCSNLNGSNEVIITKEISLWAKTDIIKGPAIFCIGHLVN